MVQLNRAAVCRLSGPRLAPERAGQAVSSPTGRGCRPAGRPRLPAMAGGARTLRASPGTSGYS